ncbi:DUF2190 family protein [Martelella lutilitoris]|uniref:DUF2190 family protein n=1 Tax=Martelella lutilitoris TaxID=2583532 RepID=A0A7T7HMN6_9HYPH|nr:DUF2190 family protein [Martelella lutilitoris]QQM31987.1 DUF2190 family protein [Martelella lutilitoris]
MKNFIQPGNIVDLTAPAGGLASGQAYLFGSLFGVATTGAAEGQRLAVSLEGVFDLPKAAGDSLGEGEAVYWDGTAISATSEGNTLVGHAVAAAPAAATTVYVRVRN